MSSINLLCVDLRNLKKEIELNPTSDRWDIYMGMVNENEEELKGFRNSIPKYFSFSLSRKTKKYFKQIYCFRLIFFNS